MIAGYFNMVPPGTMIERESLDDHHMKNGMRNSYTSVMSSFDQLVQFKNINHFIGMNGTLKTRDGINIPLILGMTSSIRHDYAKKILLIALVI